MKVWDREIREMFRNLWVWDGTTRIGQGRTFWKSNLNEIC